MTRLERLREVIATIAAGNPFYAPRLAKSGVGADVSSFEEFSRRMGFTTKADLVRDQAEHPPAGSNRSFPIARYTRFCQTSGTTGRPLVILDTNESWQWMLDNWAVIYRESGVVAGDRVYFAFSFGPFLGFWTAFEAAAKYGCLCLPGGGLTSAGRVRAIIQHQAQVLCCTPTYALHLAETAKKEGIDLRTAAVRTIIVAGEPGGSEPHVRSRMSAAWNDAKIVDHYGMTEVGPVAYEDAGRPGHMRIIENSYYAEVLDHETLEPVPEGETGELILTTLGRSASPLLRYRTGDIVKATRDTQGLVLEGGIIGRADDMVVVRGVNIYPSAIDELVRTIPEIGEYRVEVTRRGHMAELRLQIEASDASASRRLEQTFDAAFSLRIPVACVAENSLPRFELKAQRWVTHPS